MNTRINKHIQSAKLFESVVREVEEVIEGGGGLDNDSLKRIYDAKMASADAPGEEKEALELMDLVIEKPPASLARSAHLVRGDHIDQRDLLRRLAELQYTRNEMDFRRATYRVRGDVIDIFPAEEEKEAVRIELFDDEIEDIPAGA